MFVRGTELLVFDDLSSALDAETETERWTRLVVRGRDATCLVVSHRPTALRLADEIIVLKDGRVRARGMLDEHLEPSRTCGSHGWEICRVTTPCIVGATRRSPPRPHEKAWIQTLIASSSVEWESQSLLELRSAFPDHAALTLYSRY